MIELIKNYKIALQKIYDHVGFKENWVIFPVGDCTDKYWETNGDIVNYADSIEELEDKQSGNYYRDDVYKQRLYNKWIYEGNDITMAFCDPHVDNMKWFRIFDNKKKELKNESFRKI